MTTKNLKTQTAVEGMILRSNLEKVLQLPEPQDANESSLNDIGYRRTVLWT